MIPDTRLEQLRGVRSGFRNWPKVTLAGLLWKHLPLPATSITATTRRGTLISCPLRPDAGSLYTALEVFAFGAYERLGSLDANPFVLDIGANLGAFVMWANEAGDGVRGLAFEPDPVAFAFLRRNLSLNEITTVTPRRAAVAATSGAGSLHRRGDGGGISTLHPETDASGSLRQTLDVSIEGFDDLVSSLGGEQIDVLKLDCEGAEHSIVMDSGDESWRQVRRVALEYHPVRDRSAHALEERLVARGFTVLARDVFADELGMLWLSR